MRFFDREQEFEKLREIEEASHEVAQFTIIGFIEFTQTLRVSVRCRGGTFFCDTLR